MVPWKSCLDFWRLWEVARGTSDFISICASLSSFGCGSPAFLGTFPLLFWMGLHWLPLCFQVQFKVLVITKIFHGMRPDYLRDYLSPVISIHPIGSSRRGMLWAPTARESCLMRCRKRAFGTTSPKTSDWPQPCWLSIKSRKHSFTIKQGCVDCY